MLCRLRRLHSVRTTLRSARETTAVLLHSTEKFLVNSGFALSAWPAARHCGSSAVSAAPEAKTKPNPLTFIRPLTADDAHPSVAELDAFNRELSSSLLLWSPLQRSEWLNGLHIAHSSQLRSMGGSPSSLVKYDRCIATFLQRQRGTAMDSPFVQGEQLRYHWLFYVQCSQIVKMMRQMQSVPQSLSVSRTALLGSPEGITPERTRLAAERIYRERRQRASLVTDPLFGNEGAKDHTLSAVFNQQGLSTDFEFGTVSTMQMTPKELQWASFIDACHHTLTDQMVCLCVPL